MPWKINKIRIENFKFFKDSFELNVRGKNFLLYGENGSGKSSIYWSFYTFLQSCYKKADLENAQKYFCASHPDNLRNRFSKDEDKSGIYIDFININEHDNRHLYYEDSCEICNTALKDDNFIRITAAASDFLNYKFLAALFDFKNSQKPEVFSIIERDVLPSLLFNYDPRFAHFNGTIPSVNATAHYWWKYIKENFNTLPKSATNKKYVLKTSDEYKRFDNLISAFNEQLESYLTQIEANTNQKLDHEFKIPVRIEIKYDPCKITHKRVGPEDICNIDIKKPSIFLQADFIHEKASTKEVLHPRSFFNEAKLTCMAIAIRLAMVEYKYKATEDGVSALFMDDLLISLDMSTRLEVIDILLNYGTKYQLFIFTHDRAYFNILKDRIFSRGQKSDWEFSEMYCLDGDLSPYPKPLMLRVSTILDKARSYITTCDYSAAANALRRACEEELKRILPYCKQTSVNDKQCDPSRIVTLSKMIDNFIDFCHKNKIVDFVPDLHFCREYIFNPLSHNDTRTPIFRSELIRGLRQIEKLSNIKKSVLVNNTQCNQTEQYYLKIDNDFYFKFYFKDIFSVTDIGNQRIIDNPDIVISHCPVHPQIETREFKIKAAFNLLRKLSSYNGDLELLTCFTNSNPTRFLNQIK